MTNNGILPISQDITFTLLYNTIFVSRNFHCQIPSEAEFLSLCQKLYPKPNYEAIDREDMDNLFVLFKYQMYRTMFSSIITRDIPTKNQLAALGRCSHRAQENDKIVIVLGCEVPLLLREDGTNAGDYTFVGPIYVHGYTW